MVENCGLRAFEFFDLTPFRHLLRKKTPNSVQNCAPPRSVLYPWRLTSSPNDSISPARHVVCPRELPLKGQNSAVSTCCPAACLHLHSHVCHLQLLCCFRSSFSFPPSRTDAVCTCPKALGSKPRRRSAGSSLPSLPNSAAQPQFLPYKFCMSLIDKPEEARCLTC